MAAMLRAVMAIATVAAISAIAMGANYDVGGPAGSWDLATNYTQWVSGKAFRVGDTMSESSPSSFPPLYIAYDVKVYDVMHILGEVIKK
uniref:Phytocyanin domain-containing protein n=1 Tax=Musa acuminata subsp. malaccensis TaxID=214687 RepID=A0A804JIB9_MUSAM